jgi:hypothetical protein
MDDTVAILNLLAESHDFILVHGPNLIESVLVTFLKALILLLEQEILLCESFVVFGHSLVVFLELCRLGLKLNLHGRLNFLELTLFLFERLKHALVDLFSISENFMVEIKLLLIQSVHGFHVLHALL